MDTLFAMFLQIKVKKSKPNGSFLCWASARRGGPSAGAGAFRTLLIKPASNQKAANLGGIGRLPRLAAMKRWISAAIAAAVFSASSALPAAEAPAPFHQIVRDAGPDVITIGLVDTFSPEFYVGTFSKTADRLMQAMPEKKFRFVEIDYRDAGAGIDREKPDFVICSASTYADLAASRGAQQIGTRMTPLSRSVSESVASVFIVKAGSSYASLEDLRGAAVAAADVGSFDGWLIAQGELAKQGLDPDAHFSQVVQTRYGIPDAAALVALGQVQAGIFSSEQFESLLNMGLAKAEDFRVIAAKNAPGEPARSTDRYPDAVFASLPWAQSRDVTAVTVALLSMSSPNGAFRWEVCNDFVPTMDLLKTLAIGPYSYLKDMSLEGLARRFKVEIVLFALFAAAVAFHIVTVNVLVRRRTAQLVEAADEIRRSHEEAERSRRQIAMLERAGVVAQLSSLFAHEIKQPVMNIALYCGTLRMYLKKKQALTETAAELMASLEAEVDRTSEIVRQVRSYAKKQERMVSCCRLTEVARKAAAAAGSPALEWGEMPADACVLADPFELQFVCANFIKNAADAVKGVSNPKIRIDIQAAPQGWSLSVTDNGPAISDEAFARLGRITASSKADGLGFGLAIAASMAEVNGGHLEFKRMQPTGLCAVIVLKGCRPAQPAEPHQGVES